MEQTNIDKNIYNVFDIGNKVKELYYIIAENEGEVDEEQYSLLQFQKNEIKQNGIDIIHVRDKIQSVSDMLSKQIERLTELKAKKDKQIVAIEKALMWVLLNFGEQDKKGIWRLDLDIAQLSTRKNPESVVIEDESLVPNDYKKFEYTIKDLTFEQAEIIQKLFAGDLEINKIEQISKFNVELKLNQKVSKKELKPKLVESELLKEKLKKDFETGVIDELEFDQINDEITNYGAYIKEGDLNLVIK